MPIAMEGSEYQSQYWEAVANGPVQQVDLSAWSGLSAGGAPPASLGASVTYSSGVIQAGGFKAIALAVKLANAGQITLTRYVDKLGNLPVAAPATATLVGGTPNVITITDNLPFQSFSFTIQNGAASTAALVFSLLLNGV